MRGVSYKVYKCGLCGKDVERWEEIVKIRPRGKYGGMNTYHKECIEQERQERRIP